jgi:dienelactone hydrolase
MIGRRTFTLAAGAAALPILSRITWAQAYPSTCQAPASTKFKNVEYKSGGLRIAAYLYDPEGVGRFPVVIYNHGSRANQRKSELFQYIGDLFSQNGYVVFIPERRGYGDSDGETFDEEIGSDTGENLVERLRAEATDVLNAIPFLETLPNVDTNRLNIMGWSFGGIVTLFAASKMAFHAAIAQAPASLTWNRSVELQKALKEAARDMKSPIFLSVAKNDRTTTVRR